MSEARKLTRPGDYVPSRTYAKTTLPRSNSSVWRIPGPEKPKPPPPFLPSTSSRDTDWSPAELEFARCVDTYKRDECRPFPTLREILRLVIGLGYRKAPPEV